MKFLSARGVLPACLITVAAVVALVAPGAANATLLTQCEGAQTLEGAGSSLQAEAVEVWAKGFNTNTLSTKACKGGAGKEPKISYKSIGSGAGFKEWNEHENFGTIGFVGTDNTVNPTEKAELESKGKEAPSGKVLTTPVAEGAVAIIINLPNGCSAESKASKGRLALSQGALEKIYADEKILSAGTGPEWSELTEDGDTYHGTVVAAKVSKVKTTEGSAVITVVSGGFPGVVVGDEVSVGTGLVVHSTVVRVEGNEVELSAPATKTETGDTVTFVTPCNSAQAIKTVVREDGSGTTHIFKRFLNWSFPSPNKLTTPTGNFTWDELSEATKACPSGTSCNTLWPTGVGAIKGNTGEGVVKAVEEAANAGSIGYANLADARNPAFSKFIPPTGGEKKQLFWAVLESKAGGAAYQDPATNKDVAARASANCKSTVFSNGTASFPPPSTESNWNEVSADQYSATYPICGLTYDLVFGNYKAYKGTTQGEATTAENYLAFVLDKNGGQKEINEKHDYLSLPTAVLTKSLEGLKLVAWE
jgi:ABC-type phosphate transport system substrate-binding protein